MKLTSSTMARSDSEDVYEVTERSTNSLSLMKLQNLEVDDTVLDKPNDTTIHSGHFMVSHVHDEPPEAGDTDADEENASYDLEGPSPGPSPGSCGGEGGGGGGGGGSLVHGCRSASSLFIDGSLRKLFECMTLAHCNTLSSPKWRNFKGINVKIKDKIRLNNMIWREWHMQYIKGLAPVVCHFETQVSSKNFGTPDFWKLCLDTLTKDYKRLSRLFADRFSSQPDDHEMLTRLPPSHYELLQRVGQSASSKLANPSFINVPVFNANDDIMDDDMYNDIFDTLFTPYTSSRATKDHGMADAINTTAPPPQPSLEEFMDTLEPLPPPLAVDFRGFGRLSSNANFRSNAASGVATKVLANSVEGRGQGRMNMISQQPNQQLPAVNSQPVSFGSAEEIIALLQSQLASDISLECVMTNPSSIIDSSGYSSCTTIPSGFPVSDGNLMSGNSAAGIQLLPGNGMESCLQEYANEATNQLCNMFFLPDSSALPCQSVPLFTTVDESQGTNVEFCGSQSALDRNSRLVNKNLQLQAIFSAASSAVNQVMSKSNATKAVSLTSTSLPRIKSKHNLMEPGRASRSLGSIHSKANEGYFNARSSTDNLHESAQCGFRVPQTNVGARPKQCTTALPPLQPRQQQGSSLATSRQDVQSGKQGSCILLPKQSIQVTSSGDWTVISQPSTDCLAVPMLQDQFAFTQDTQMEENAMLGNQPLETSAKRRARHKSDQSSAARGTRPIAVFQPINPLQSKVSTRSSSKANCSVSFSLDKNTTIEPSPVDTLPTSSQVSSMPNIILATPGHTVVMTTDQLNEAIRTNSFGDSMSCSGLVDSSPQSCDFSDLLSMSGSSVRSRHTSNESTSSHYDECGGWMSKSKTEGGKQQSKEHRRVSHITAEQKRRSNIKSGFDTLINLVPDLKDGPNTRISKATALHKAAELCKKLKHERAQKHDEAEQLRNEIKSLEADISACQSKLPATGAPMVKQPVEQLNDRFEEYVCKRTLENWKFFIFGSIARSLLQSFDDEVSKGSTDQLYKSVLNWIKTHCSLASLRPVVTNSLLQLSISTSILSDASKVPDEVRETILRQKNNLR